MRTRTVATQPALLHVAPRPNKTQAEIVRRGGPFEVQAKRMRGIKQAVQEHREAIEESSAPLPVVLPRLGRMR